MAFFQSRFIRKLIRVGSDDDLVERLAPFEGNWVIFHKGTYCFASKADSSGPLSRNFSHAVVGINFVRRGPIDSPEEITQDLERYVNGDASNIAGICFSLVNQPFAIVELLRKPEEGFDWRRFNPLRINRMEFRRALRQLLYPDFEIRTPPQVEGIRLFRILMWGSVIVALVGSLLLAFLTEIFVDPSLWRLCLVSLGICGYIAGKLFGAAKILNWILDEDPKILPLLQSAPLNATLPSLFEVFRGQLIWHGILFLGTLWNPG